MTQLVKILMMADGVYLDRTTQAGNRTDQIITSHQIYLLFIIKNVNFECICMFIPVSHYHFSYTAYASQCKSFFIYIYRNKPNSINAFIFIVYSQVNEMKTIPWSSCECILRKSTCVQVRLRVNIFSFLISPQLVHSTKAP